MEFLRIMPFLYFWANKLDVGVNRNASVVTWFSLTRFCSKVSKIYQTQPRFLDDLHSWQRIIISLCLQIIPETYLNVSNRTSIIKWNTNNYQLFLLTQQLLSVAAFKPPSHISQSINQSINQNHLSHIKFIKDNY